MVKTFGQNLLVKILWTKHNGQNIFWGKLYGQDIMVKPLCSKLYDGNIMVKTLWLKYYG